jgi:F0F1-type ATP synthase epsilon subunit
MAKPTFTLIIRTRQDVVYDSEVEAVTSTNAAGNFDVLPGHAFFISLIQRFIEIHETAGRVKKYDIDEGIIYVQEAKVSIYLERPPREIT